MFCKQVIHIWTVLRLLLCFFPRPPFSKEITKKGAKEYKNQSSAHTCRIRDTVIPGNFSEISSVSYSII